MSQNRAKDFLFGRWFHIAYWPHEATTGLPKAVRLAGLLIAFPWFVLLSPMTVCVILAAGVTDLWNSL
jgi:hypothetical protein